MEGGITQTHSGQWISICSYSVTCLSFSMKNDVLAQLVLHNSESPLTLFEAHKHAFSNSSSVRHFDRRQRRLLVKIITILKIAAFISRQVEVPGRNVKSWFRGTERRCYCIKDVVSQLDSLGLFWAGNIWSCWRNPWRIERRLTWWAGGWSWGT